MRLFASALAAASLVSVVAQGAQHQQGACECPEHKASGGTSASKGAKVVEGQLSSVDHVDKSLTIRSGASEREVELGSGADIFVDGTPYSSLALVDEGQAVRATLSDEGKVERLDVYSFGHAPSKKAED